MDMFDSFDLQFLLDSQNGTILEDLFDSSAGSLDEGGILVDYEVRSGPGGSGTWYCIIAWIHVLHFPPPLRASGVLPKLWYFIIFGKFFVSVFFYFIDFLPSLSIPDYGAACGIPSSLYHPLSSTPCFRSPFYTSVLVPSINWNNLLIAFPSRSFRLSIQWNLKYVSHSSTFFLTL